MTARPTPSLTSSPIAIEDGWIDYNGHLNMAYFNVIFDRALDEILLPLGLGPQYVKETGCTYMAAEAHICFLREVFRTDKVRVNLSVLDLDTKRMHLFCEMRHAEEGWLAATSEWMFLHVDTRARKTVPWPEDIFVRLEGVRQSSRGSGWPERAGRRIGIPPKA
jgi:acyl-CoA thioester hydrolase